MKYVCVTLIGAHKVYSKDLFFKYILNLRILPQEIWISCTKEIFDQFTDTYSGDIPVIWVHGDDDTGDDQIHSTTSAREALRQKIIKSDYIWSMWLDNDILVPKDMVNTFLNYLDLEPDLLWVHGHHAYRLGDGKRLRHGLGSCFIHKDLLEGIPFVRCEVRGRNIGDDYFWITMANIFERLNKIKIIHGVLFDVLHLRKDGTIVKMSREYFK